MIWTISNKAIPILLERFGTFDDLTEVKFEDDDLMYDYTSSCIKSCNDNIREDATLGDELSVTMKKEAESLDDRVVDAAVHDTVKDDKAPIRPQRIANIDLGVNKQESNPIIVKYESLSVDDNKDESGLEYVDDDNDKDYVPNEKEIDIKDHVIEDDDVAEKEHVVPDPITANENKINCFPSLFLKCSRCEKSFNGDMLKVHFKRSHGLSEEQGLLEANTVKRTQKAECSFCKQQVWMHDKKKHFSLKHNMRVQYEQPSLFFCPICSLRFTKESLMSHMQLKHESKSVSFFI